MTKASSFAALLMGGLLCGTSAVAQTASQIDRLQRLEVQMAALDGTVQVAQDSSLAADFEVRLQRLERDVSVVTGRYEETAYQLVQMRERLEKMNADIDFRLKEMESKGGGAMGGSAMGDGALGPKPSKAAEKQPERAPEKAPEKPAPTPALPANASPEKQYEHAFELLRQSDYDKAEKALQEFIAKNKSHPYAANAQYWLGESYFVRNKFTDAAQAFAENLSKYPKNPKAPDSLLKLGMTLQQLNKKSEACTAFNQLMTKFPEASASVKRRADTERKRINCPS
ncbi:tol-pal system protein YbgF [Azospirillum griseum]|uniref:Cell division coordinator CpoB n=1 Tax=Azospirillum griseum TaxID=2496639 RepID=A0A3S0KDY3_9PROT|nr:tol-pal system protein YbgF [Azospirillum griseum]RTR23770.1 tol-pal system protein YbgF [Azospirillum griseum]